jgi:hypothetical protein
MLVVACPAGNADGHGGAFVRAVGILVKNVSTLEGGTEPP